MPSGIAFLQKTVVPTYAAILAIGVSAVQAVNESAKHCQVYRDVTTSPALYLMHPLTNSLRNVKFCPYEDVLGVGHATGFSSLLVPGYSVFHVVL